MTTSRPRALVAAALTIMVALVGCAAPQAPIPRVTKVALAGEASVQRLTKLSTLSYGLLSALVDADQPGCSAAVGERGSVVWAGAAGIADLTTGAPLTPDTRFDIASISKQFTATAVLLLQRDGLLSLSDPLAAHVGGLPSWAQRVTLEQLMHHTARVPDFWVQLERVGIGFADPADQSTVLSAIARERELVDGEGYAYSNSHYVLLAQAVENVSGQRFADVIDARIAAPLDLELTVAPSLQEPDVATPYDADGSELRGGWSAYGHSGVITTPSELVRWGDQYRTGEIVLDDPVSVDPVLGAAVVLDDDGEPTGEWYGAGIRIEPTGDLYHSGRWGGFISDFAVTADRQTVIAVSCNGRDAPRFELADGLRQIWSPVEEE